MIQYAILISQGHNRVYFEASKKLSLAELEIAAKTFSVACGNFSTEAIEGVFYVLFDASSNLSEEDILFLSRLSFVYALFEVKKINNKVLFSPVRKEPPYYFDEDISVILKYTGKTNEIFTRLLINIAVFSSEYHRYENINLLDPVAGKGTTLFEGLVSGYNCYGVEISPKAVRDGVIYLKKYLETAKYKHTCQTTKYSGENKSFSAEINSFTMAKDKDDLKAGKTLAFNFVAGDSKYTDKYFKKDFFHVIAGDLPYGVQHGNISNQRQSSFTRNPGELLKLCLPNWIHCLKRGGTVALAWNKHVLSRESMEKIFADCGITVLNTPPYNQFAHRVDQAINRDVIVAKK